MKKTILTVGLIATTIITYGQATSPLNVNPGDADELYWKKGNVGIGTQDPKSELSVYLGTDMMTENESGIRINYPATSTLDPSYPGDPAPINTGVFEIRQSTLMNGVFDTKMIVKPLTGFVGIATDSPDAIFNVADNNGTDIDAHLEGFTLIDGNEASLLFGRETGASHGEWGIEYNDNAQGLNFWKPAGGTTGYAGTNYHLFLNKDGKVSIGLDPMNSNTFNGEYRLYVGEGIMTEKVKVAVRTSTDWSDYVFAEGYQLCEFLSVSMDRASHNTGSILFFGLGVLRHLDVTPDYWIQKSVNR